MYNKIVSRPEGAEKEGRGWIVVGDYRIAPPTPLFFGHHPTVAASLALVTIVGLGMKIPFLVLAFIWVVLEVAGRICVPVRTMVDVDKDVQRARALSSPEVREIYEEIEADLASR